MAKIVILSPLDVKPGATYKGKVVVHADLYAPAGDIVVVSACFDDGTEDAFQWPSGEGWTTP